MGSEESTNASKEQFSKLYQKHHHRPHFDWKNLPATDRLAYEMLSVSNYRWVYEMFREDPNPFIQEDYKTLADLEKYVDYQLNVAYYSPKRGGCNWLFKLKDTNEYIGIINLYELSKETFADNDKKCMLGYNTSEKYRRKGYTREAVIHLINYAYEILNLEKIIAKTEKENHVSKALLATLNFREETEKYYYSELFDFFELTKNHFIKVLD